MPEEKRGFPENEMKVPEKPFGHSVPAQQEGTKSSLGLVVMGLVVVLCLLLAGLFLWQQALTDVPASNDATTPRPTREENNEPESTTAEATYDTLLTTSSSDEISALKADLDSTPYGEIEAEFTAIEAELGL